MARKKTQERVDAADLFINSNLDYKKISAIVGVSTKQLSAWAKEEDWELQRTAQQVTVDKIIAGYYFQLSSIQRQIKEDFAGIPTPAQADQQHKLADAIDKLKKKQNLSTYHTVLSELLKWLKECDVESAKVLAPKILDFMREKAKTIRDDA